MPKVDPQDLEFGPKLGFGATSSVCKVKYKPNNQDYALKIIKFTEQSSVIQTIVNELHTQSKLDHPNIVHLFSAFYYKKQIHILMQLIDGASLFDYLNVIPTVPEQALGYLTWQSLQGLYYLRTHHVIHRDLKPSNILLSKNGQAKIADFGLAKELRESTQLVSSFTGTICYMAPERLQERDYSFVSDIWSLGVIVYQCAYGEFPLSKMFKKKIDYWELISISEQNIDIQLPPQYSPDLTTFLKKCLQINPKERATVEMLLTDPWVQQFQDPSNAIYLQQYIQQADKQKKIATNQRSDALHDFGF